jgi:hypothetical protein
MRLTSDEGLTPFSGVPANRALVITDFTWNATGTTPLRLVDAALMTTQGIAIALSTATSDAVGSAGASFHFGSGFPLRAGDTACTFVSGGTLANGIVNGYFAKSKKSK